MFPADLLFRLVRHRVIRSDRGKSTSDLEKFKQNDDDYRAWRKAELIAQFDDHFSRHEVAGRDVLDFGCGLGELCFLLHASGAARVLGIDLDRKAVESAMLRQAAMPTAPDGRLSFQVATKTDAIELPSQSFDVILCFDVLEHVMEYQRIVSEWARVLRPGGSVLIWWQPYFHPYGHHLADYAPVPWMHLFLSDRQMLRICERMVDTPGFRHARWDRDAEGRPLPNRFRKAGRIGHLNRLTIAGFERVCAEAGLRIARREFHPFRVLGRRSSLSAVLRLPLVREVMTAYAVYELQLPRSG